ncbi:serine aminopeptidase domain-containing protein [Paraburkholderia dilworthii]|uniref:serine aminopeptidase domain-containing protein n=1 Tax=Paraburkholderia dilworthii TaxID=948106 RepID=UPI0003FD93F7|nr:alpha/beta hydrolase [Paraburkholderia dilworthii]
MKPIVFGGRFGWLHHGQSTRGVVICSPFGHEEAWCHKGIRYLAEELSAYGIPVLRFDYLAAGDSIGIDGDDHHLDAFVADTVAAVERLKELTGVTSVTLCGFRLGATVAALASCHHAVDSLALLAPVTRGRAYLHELSALRKVWLENLAAPLRARQSDKPLNVLGQVYSDRLCSELDALDLARTMERQSSIPARALVLDAWPRASAALCSSLRLRGVGLETGAFEGYIEYVNETKSSVVPARSLARVAEWVASIDHGAPARSHTNIGERPAESLFGEAIIETPEARERPVVFGAHGLFGILCEPRGSVARGPIMLITNTAGSVHHGDSRLSVRIAREMARRGIASMRIDARGIGDSPPRSVQGPLDLVPSIHASKTIEDVATAAAWLKRKGYSTVISFGICSGAYSAVRASLVEPALTAVIAVNLALFYISEDIPIAQLEEMQRHSMARVGPAIFKPSKWWLVLSGRRKLGPIVQAVASNVVARLRSYRLDATGNGAGSGEDDSCTDPHAVVRVLERKGVKTLFIYGSTDEGIEQFNTHFGKRGKKLSRFSNVRAAVLDDIDHALFDPRASAIVTALAEAFIKGLPQKAASRNVPDPLFSLPQRR